MSNAAIDWNSQPVHFPQFDSDQPDPPDVARLEGLLHGNSETCAEQFIEWLRSDEQAETLYHMIIDRLGDDDITAAAEQWAKQAA
ncbi:hypothetical protein FZZ93_05630 [Halomonas eurihalina]|uniref:Uncharacterized protein n=1 Tax=Halomonas eurihalina TaxID=42566 RepID=A0A5D9D9U5_HALER|nr:hypothetical protein [Halomonas eurihalina]MDR5859437.1 hypothetical protein [Halomonas eurihalina]TZG40527.1 hypothetical protein FZZ93_05630 [Halomonas eurihalina]